MVTIARIEVSAGFAKELKGLQADLSEALGVKISLPETTEILTRSQQVPRLDIKIKKRSGRGGKEVEINPILGDILK